MEIKIESNIELPDHGWRGAPLPNYPKTSDYPWEQMKLGDSFFVELPDGCDLVRLMNGVTGSAAARLGAGRVSARCVEENGRIGVRAWLKLEK
jgi:hypothetical protein